MNRSAGIIITSIISCFVTLFVVHHWNLTPKPLYSPPAHIPPPARIPPPTRVARGIPPSAPSLQSTLGTRGVSPLRPNVKSIDCSGDYNICGEGGYCCNGVCVKAVNVELSFVADDMGELYLCQQHGYNLVASTDHYQETGKYRGPMPCADTYLTITNTALEGGGLILILGDHIYGASGGPSLYVESEINKNGVFAPVVPFGAISQVSPYREYGKYWGAYPVTDANDSYAKIITLKFTPAGC